MNYSSISRLIATAHSLIVTCTDESFVSAAVQLVEQTKGDTLNAACRHIDVGCQQTNPGRFGIHIFTRQNLNCFVR